MPKTLTGLAASLTLFCTAVALAHGHEHNHTHNHAPAHDATHTHTTGALHIQQPWSRPTVAAVPVGVVYVDLKNDGSKMERLLSASSDVAERVELHASSMDGQMMRMRQIHTVDIAPKSTTQLKPGGMHIMLMGLKAPLIQGQRFTLNLVFEQAGSVPVQVLVRDPVESAAEHGGHGGHGKQHNSHHGHKH